MAWDCRKVREFLGAQKWKHWKILQSLKDTGWGLPWSQSSVDSNVGLKEEKSGVQTGSGTLALRWDPRMAAPSVMRWKKPHLANVVDGTTHLPWLWLRWENKRTLWEFLTTSPQSLNLGIKIHATWVAKKA